MAVCGGLQVDEQWEESTILILACGGDVVLHALEAFLISTRHRLRGKSLESETFGQETRSLEGGAATGDVFKPLPLEQEIFDSEPLGSGVPPATCWN